MAPPEPQASKFLGAGEAAYHGTAHCGRGRLRVVIEKADERPPGSLCMSRGQPAAARAEMKTGAHDIEADPQPQAAMREVSQPLTPTGSVTRVVDHSRGVVSWVRPTIQLHRHRFENNIAA